MEQIVDESNKQTEQKEELEVEKHSSDLVSRKLFYESETEEQRQKNIEQKSDMKKIKKSNKYLRIEKLKE